METALEMGINLDHADIYGVDGGGRFGDAEALFGAVLPRPHPERMIPASKGGIAWSALRLQPRVAAAGLQDSLRRLRVETIDLYQIHRPDFLGHPARIAEVLTALRDEGKIRHVGVSNYTPSQFRALQAHLPFPIATHQPQFSCWHHAPLRDGVLDQCLELGVTPLAWSPIAGGRMGMTLEDAARSPEGQRLVDLLTTLDGVAEAQGVSRTAVALAWLLAHPAGVLPILGTQRLERIRSSADAFKVTLDRATWNAILVAAQGEPLP